MSIYTVLPFQYTIYTFLGGVSVDTTLPSPLNLLTWPLLQMNFISEATQGSGLLKSAEKVTINKMSAVISDQKIHSNQNDISS